MTRKALDLAARPAADAPDTDRRPIDALLGGHPGPALLLDDSGRPRLSNAAAAPIGRALVHGDLAALVEAAGAVAATGIGDRVDVTADGRAYEIVLLPWDAAPCGVLALGRDVEADRSLRRALVESRQRYKDFAACASDVLWETDAEGRFTFVSPGGALGFAARDLVGRRAGDLRAPGPRRGLTDPFRADIPVTDQDLRLITADGGQAAVLVSAVPVFGPGGAPAGARGVWRDVTAEHAREAELVGLRRREHAIALIVGAMRDEAEVGAMLGQAAQALAEIVDAAFVAVATVAPEGLELAASAGEVPGWLLPVASSHLGEDVARAARDLVGEGVAMLLIATRSRGRVNGALCVGRAEAEGWGDEDRAVVHGIADAVGQAIEQVREHEAVRRLSRVDGLTGLLNRRAFREEIERRAALAVRRAAATTVFYIDLDHFKQVNDSAGHAAGDAALVAVARLLAELFRRADIVARLGGDEFAVWCDDMPEASARAKAACLGDAARALGRLSPPGAPPLGLSIGVACRAGDAVADVDALLAEADGALYAAKRGGRGRFVIAADTAAARPPADQGGDRC